MKNDGCKDDVVIKGCKNNIEACTHIDNTENCLVKSIGCWCYNVKLLAGDICVRY